jgi:hypothetical protein
MIFSILFPFHKSRLLRQRGPLPYNLQYAVARRILTVGFRGLLDNSNLGGRGSVRAAFASAHREVRPPLLRTKMISLFCFVIVPSLAWISPTFANHNTTNTTNRTYTRRAPAKPTPITALPTHQNQAQTGFENSRPLTGFEGHRTPTGFENSQLRTGFEDSRPTTGFENHRTPTGFENTQNPTAISPSRPYTGFENSRTRTGFESSQIHRTMPTHEIQTGFNRSRATTGFEGSRPRTGFENSKPSTGFSSTGLPTAQPAAR